MGNLKPADYKAAVDYIENLPMFTEKHSLSHTRQFLSLLGDPSLNRKIVHVAGTNGKGSVCAYMQAILESEGKKTGFFTSPHLLKINERIQIDRTPIDDDFFYQVFDKAYDVACAMEEQGEGHPSYFEFLFGMGLLAFEMADVEYIILETGIGGRLDATNAIETPALSVITSISMDHTYLLGDTIEKIAYQKAGIIKDHVPVVFDGNDEAATAVMIEEAIDKKAPYRMVKKEDFSVHTVSRKQISFSRRISYDKDTVYTVPICGLYQVVNAGIAIAACEILLGSETEPAKSNNIWRDAVASIHWKGRMEEVAERFVVDGAHNPGAIEAFVESVSALHENEKGNAVILFSAVSDKEYDTMIEYLCKNLPVKCYVVTEITDKRRVDAEALGDIFKKYTDQPVYTYQSPKEALLKAKEEQEADGYVYCIGSLYLVGEVESLL